jgi:hypothetical protein
MKTGLVLSAFFFLIAGLAVPSYSSRLPASPDMPTGCATGAFDVIIVSSRQWGVVPFACNFSVKIVGTQDSVEAVQWNFGAGDVIGAIGARSSHVFTEPVDYEVVARVSTSLHGTVTRQVTVSGYRAVMTLTFDDGQKTVLTDAVPLLASYGVTATAYIVPSWTYLDPDDYMTWDDIGLLQDAGWDIGSHSMTHPKLTEVDPFDLVWEVSQSQIELRSRGFPARNFSLPHEAYDDNVLDVVRQYYKSCKTDKGINPGIKDTDPFMIKSQTSQSWRPFDFYQAHIDSVLETHGWYVLNNHILTDDCDGMSWCVQAERIAQVIEYARSNRVKVANIEEVMENRVAGLSLGDDEIPAGLEDSPAVRVLSAPQRLSYGPVTIEFYVSSPGCVGVSVYDVMGRRVRPLIQSAMEAGGHVVSWDGRSESGELAASGYYFVVFHLDGRMQASARIMVLR